MCVRITPMGTGSGNSNFPKRPPQIFFVNNKCPECGPANLDLAQTSDGRWDMEWQAVDCPVSGGIQLMLKSGSSIWHTEIQARNFRIPIKSLSYYLNGQWISFERKEYNFFYYDQAINENQFPISVRLVSVKDETLEIQVRRSDYNTIEPNLINTNVQFSGNGTGGASNPPPPSSVCAQISAAYDPSDRWWIEVNAPPSSDVQVECAKPTRQTFSCFPNWGKYQCNPDWECSPDSASSPRYAIVNGNRCRLTQYYPRAEAQQTQDYSASPIPEEPPIESTFWYGVAGGVVLLLLIMVGTIIFWKRRIASEMDEKA